MASDIDVLVDMGFSRAKAQKAWKAINGAGLQPAIDWLLAHPEVTDEPEDEMDSSQVVGTGGQTLASTPQGTTSSGAEEGEVKPEQQTAQSLVCDDCGKVFRDANSAQMHAARSSHQSFSESTEAIKPLTEEEKKAKLADLKARLAEKRAAQAQKEIEDRKEQERIRRKAGRDISEARAKLEEKELKQAAAAKRREKEEDKIARAKIKAQIEQDKRERAAKREAAKNKLQSEAAAQTQQTPPAATAASQPKRTYNEARLQIRLPGSTPITQTFPATATLADVYQHLYANGVTNSFALSTTFPKRTFTEDDKGKSLRDLNLVPSSALNLAYI